MAAPDGPAIFFIQIPYLSHESALQYTKAGVFKIRGTSMNISISRVQRFRVPSFALWAMEGRQGLEVSSFA
jgi:hypothetical protein